MPKKVSNKSSLSVAELWEQVSKETGVDLYAGDDPELKLEVLPLGLEAFDRALSGGFAWNRITLLVGDEGAGKTLLALAAIKAAQAKDPEVPVIFIDVEGSYTPEWAAQVGVDPSKIHVARPVNGEKAFDLARAAVKMPERGILIVDSLAAMPPASEMEEETEHQTMGVQARMINRSLRMLNTDLHIGPGWMVILINQIREKLGVVYGNPEVIPGGRGQRFYAWQTVRVRKGEALEEGTGKDKRLIGRTVKISVPKNKQGPSEMTGEVPFFFTGEFDELSGIIDLALELGVITANGGFYTVEDIKYHGRKSVRDALAADPELTALLRDKIANVETVEL